MSGGGMGAFGTDNGKAGKNEDKFWPTQLPYRYIYETKTLNKYDAFIRL